MTSIEKDKVKDYFERNSYEFDLIYEGGATSFERLLTRFFRAGVFERFRITLDACKDAKGKRILDVGCGSGRVLVALAKEGALLTGIDTSESMLCLAKKRAMNENVLDKVTLIHGDFERFEFPERFDITVALGYFDYVRDQLALLRRISNLSTEFSISSFPTGYSLQAPLRRIYLKRKGLPVYFYSESYIRLLCSLLRIEDFKIIRTSGGFMLKTHGSRDVTGTDKTPGT